MAAKNFRRILTLTLTAAFLWPVGIRASESVALRPGTRIAVDVARTGHVVGTVQVVEAGGFILKPESGDEVFVAIVTAAVIGGLAIATRGLVPGCLFARCD